MKKIITMILCFIVLFSLASCGSKEMNRNTNSPVDCGGATTVAKKEFERIFANYKDLEIYECSTAVRTNDSNKFIVEFKYSSSGGNGEYGFELEKTVTGSFNIIHQGKDVTLDNLVEE